MSLCPVAGFPRDLRDSTCKHSIQILPSFAWLCFMGTVSDNPSSFGKEEKGLSRCNVAEG